jgi:hypothetical protein
VAPWPNYELTQQSHNSPVSQTSPSRRVTPGGIPAEHAPVHPNQLRESRTHSREEMSSTDPIAPRSSGAQRSLRDRVLDFFHASPSPGPSQSLDIVAPGKGTSHGGEGQRRHQPGSRTSLLESYHGRESVYGLGQGDHGTFSHRAATRDSPRSSISSFQGFEAGLYAASLREGSSGSHQPVGSSLSDGPGVDSGLSTTKRLAMEHGVKNHRTMYVCYHCISTLKADQA